ncbi:MAG: serine--tRNA ligase, partial [Syntrophobacteraceae bacterium]|nr:serine--tRNA ligase [Syntrophobacteraceae bacterium]
MLDLRFVRENVDRITRMLENRRLDMDLKPFLELDEKRRNILREVEVLKHQRNVASEEISRLKREKKEAGELIEKMKGVSQSIKDMDQELESIETSFREILFLIPNMPHESVVAGVGEKDNPVVKTWGSPPRFDFEPKPHWDVGENLGILDFERAAKMTGARFALYWGMGAALERALISLMLDIHTRRHGYTEVLPPFMVNST